MQLDQGVRTLFGQPPTTGRANPAGALRASPLAEAERKQSARLMRVNHTGEVCAQALYQGQALTARRETVRHRLLQAAAEENDHLDWCAGRLRELGSHTSVLNPFFYTGSLLIGALNGQLGDRWNLGFLAETERQVVNHLENHLQRLPVQDTQSQVILETMRGDEEKHALTALESGGRTLPWPVRWLMRAAAKVMTRATYWI
jgi:ubiquinone biosynthesis monooxygenase Coq7